MNPLLAALVQLGVLTQQEAERISRQMSPALQRQYAETVLNDALTRALGAQRRRLLDVVTSANNAPTARQMSLFWQGEDAALWGDVQPAVEQIALEMAVTAAITTGDDTWTKVNERVIGWVQDYYTNADASFVGSVPNLNLTSKTQFADYFTQWQRGELDVVGSKQGLPQLIQAIEPVFGSARAEKIGVTEVTRIYSESTVASAMANEFVTHLRWNTAFDDVVCDVCGPLNGQVVRKGEMFEGDLMPPAHVNCRCFLSEETELTMNVRDTRE